MCGDIVAPTRKLFINKTAKINEGEASSPSVQNDNSRFPSIHFYSLLAIRSSSSSVSVSSIDSGSEAAGVLHLSGAVFINQNF